MTTFADFLADRFARRTYLVEITGYDLVAQEEKTLYFAQGHYTTKPTDVAPNRTYHGRLATPFTFRRELYGDSRIGGATQPGYGTIVVNNDDGAYDHLMMWSFFGRRAVVRLGDQERMPLADFGVIFDGLVDTVSFDRQTVSFSVRDKRHLLDKPVTESKYAGTGGLEGGADLKNKNKPACFGIVRDIQPVYLGIVSGFPTYQVHDPALGPIDDIPQVCENAFPLTKVGGTPSSGQYQVNTTDCTFRVATIPQGTITSDVQGHTRGGVLLTTIADIARDIAIEIAGVGTPDESSIAALNALNSHATGYYTGANATKCNQILDAIVNAGGAWWDYSRLGLFRVGRLDPPAVTEDAEFSDNDVLSIQLVGAPPPAWRITLGHTRAWTVLTGNDIAVAASESRRQFIGEEWRTVKWPATSGEEDAIKTAHLNAQDTRFDALIDGETDAQAEVNRLGALYGIPREIFRVRVKTRPFALDLGQTVLLRNDRFNLSAGKRFRIIGMDEDSSANEVEMTLWG